MPKRGPEATKWKLQFFFRDTISGRSYWGNYAAFDDWRSWDEILVAASFIVAPNHSPSHRYVSKTGIRFPFVRPPYA